MSFWVYILKCADNSYYTGHTDNLEERIAKHRAGEIHGIHFDETANNPPVLGRVSHAGRGIGLRAPDQRLESEKEGTTQLTERRDATRRQLEAVSQGVHVNQSYADTTPVLNHRFLNTNR